MIITCNSCNKKFDIDSSLIPDKGRLLQCAGCDHKWFFKKEVLKNTINPIIKDIDNEDLKIFDQNKPSNNDEINQSKLPMEKIDVDIEEEHEETIEVNNEEEPKVKLDTNINENILVNTKQKKQKNFKILNIFIVVIISFVAFIIIVDTFKYPIGQVVPNIEFILYNLYESIKDISLFIRDLT